MFEKIIQWFGGVMNKVLNIKSNPQIAQGATVAVSAEMADAIRRWKEEYIGKSPWLTKNKQSLRLPALIASEMATLVTLEADINITGSERADWLMEQFAPVIVNLHTNVEYACAMGGIVMKPYQDGAEIAVDYIHADDFFPVAFNSRGEITAAVFVERKHISNLVYSRAEYHSVNGTTYTITNECYRGHSDTSLGQRVSLSEVDEWRDIQPFVTIENMPFPLFAYFRIPLGNSIDPKSPLGISVYAKAEDNIKEADLQYQRLLWEFEGGELAIDASVEAFKTDKNGNPELPIGKERLYRMNDLDAHAGNPALFQPYSPTLRDGSYINGLNEVLAKIEDQTGLARGTLSDRIKETRTATEIKFSRQRTYATVTAIQNALRKALEQLVRAMDATATLYNLAPSGGYQISCVWDDSVVTDADTERQRDMQEVRDGLMKKWEYRMKWYGEDEEKAKQMTQDEEPDDDALMGFGSITAKRKKEDKQNE